MKRFLFLMILFYNNFALAQSSNLPVQLSPNVNELLRYVDVPVNKYTGIPDITIPLYEVNSGSLKLPVNLSYHGGGIKVSQEASQVGLAWVINGSGMISREINGRDDFSPYGYYNNNLQEFSGNDTYLQLERKLHGLGNNASHESPSSDANNFLYDMPGQPDADFSDYLLNFDLDYEPDVFSYNFNGLGGKFVLTKNHGVLLQDPSQGLKIIFDKANSRFTIKLNNGDTYEFFETEKAGTGAEGSAPYISAWHLTKIISADNFTIDLTYQITTTFDQRFNDKTQSYMGVNGAILTGDGSCMYPEFVLGSPPYLTYHVVQLKEIVFPLGKVEFNYSSRDDMAVDKRLTEIIVKNTLEPLDNIYYSFGQDYFISIGGSTNYDNKRLRLNSVTKKNSSAEIDHTYKFEYNAGVLPAKSSFGRDWWGYNNGKSGATSMVPRLTYQYRNSIHEIPELPNSIYADRSVAEEPSQIGMLRKIVYPTGGSATFGYEMNEYDSGNSINPDNSEIIQNIRPVHIIKNPRTGDPVSEWDLSVSADVETLNYDLRSFEGLVDLTLNPPIHGIGLGEDCYLEVIKSTNNALVEKHYLGNSGSWHHDGGGRCHTTRSFSLTKGNYKLRFYAKENSQFLKYFEIKFKYYIDDAGMESHHVLKGAGLRISRISMFDPVTSKSLIQKYVYNYLEDRNNDGITEQYSYGRLLVPNRFTSLDTRANYPVRVTNVCQRVNINSYNLYKPVKYVLGYDKVTVIDDEIGESGKSEYYYHNVPNRIFAYKMKPALDLKETGSTDFTDLKNGMLYKEIDFRKSGTDRYAKVKEQTFYYSNVLKNTVLGIKRHRNPFVSDGALIYTEAQKWFLTYYPVMQSEWVRLDSNEIKIYDSNGMANRNVMKFEYAPAINGGLPAHYFASKTTTRNSKNQLIEREITYPQDYPTNPLFQAMINRNQLNLQVNIKDINLTKNLQVGKTSNSYGSLNGNTMYKLINTEIVVSNNDSLKRIMYYNRYDNKGNLLEYVEGQKLPVAYIYGYNQTYVVAKINGTSYQNILTALNSTDQNLSYLQNYSQEQLSIELNKIRTYLNNNIPNAVIESYLYKPMIGLGSKTDAKGLTTFYEYDSFQRLKFVKDRDQNIIKANDYHYKP